MASYLIASSNGLALESVSGAMTPLTLPTTSTVRTGFPPRAALFGSNSDPYLVVVNGLTQDVYMDKTGTVRRLQVQPPAGAPTVTTGAGTDLTGVYVTAVTFKVKDSAGKLIAESGLGAVSTGSPSLSNVSLRLNAIPVSSDGTVNARGVYRSLSGGNTLYPWFDIDDNVTLSEDRGGADATISLLPTTATTIYMPPDLSLIVTWKDRLWGVGRLNPDFVQWTESLQFYAWNQANQIVVPPQNTDAFGVTAFIPRRDQLGLARRRKLYQITGDDNDSFQRVCVSETIGCLSQESVVVVRDVAYWIGDRGIAQWDNNAIQYITEAQVDPWFTTDTYFNRSLFPQTQGRYNPDTDAVEFLLATVGSSTLNCWIAFDIKGQRWFGPHVTDGLIPTCCGTNSSMGGTLTNAANLPIVVFGSVDGGLYYRDRTVADDNNRPVAFDAQTPFLGGQDPDHQKTWLKPTIHTREETHVPIGAVTLTPYVGDTQAVAGTAQSHPLTRERERLFRLGTGRYCSLRLKHTQSGEFLRIYGIDVSYVLRGTR